MNEQMLEVLIGKHLDGEITPSEDRILQAELERNDDARELLRQLRDLHEKASVATASAVVDAGADPAEVFERAWRQNQGGVLLGRVLASGYVRFALGLAAGLVLGLLVHFAIVGGQSAEPRESEPLIVQDEPEYPEFNVPSTRVIPARLWDDTTRNVDWFGFTDEAGNQWLVEGVRENTVRPAVYHGDL